MPCSLARRPPLTARSQIAGREVEHNRVIRRKELGRRSRAAAGEETPGRTAHGRHRHLHAKPDPNAADAQQIGVEARRMQAVGAPGAVSELRRVERHRRDSGAERAQARHRHAGTGEHTVLARSPEVARIVDSRRRPAPARTT
jgi:hypothetical protein